MTEEEEVEEVVEAVVAERELVTTGARHPAGTAAGTSASRRSRLLELAELGHRLVAVHPLAGDPVPVGARARSCAEHGQREHLHAAAEDVVGRQRLVAHLAEVLRARVGHVDHHLRGDLRLELDLLVGHVPPGRVEELGEQLVRAEAVRLLEQPALGPDLAAAARRRPRGRRAGGRARARSARAA